MFHRDITTKRVRRALVLALAALFLALSPAGNAAAAPAGAPGGVALDPRDDVSTLRDAAPAAACPVPGDRVKTTSSSAVYVIDPEYDLNWVPNRTVYENVFDTWDGILTFDNLFTECYAGYYTLTGGHLAKTASSANVYIYQAAVEGYRHVVSAAVFDKYDFAWAKIRVQASVSPVSSLTWWR